MSSPSWVAELEPFGLLRLTGPQRIWFLQNTITNDVDHVEDDAWVESFFLTPKGKVLAHFRVGVLTDEVRVLASPPADELIDWFQRYRFRTKVEIEEFDVRTWAVVGAAAADVLGRVVVEGDATWFGGELDGQPVALVAAPELPEVLGAFDVVASEQFERLRVRAGSAKFGVDYTTDHLPQESGLAHIVKVDKGCYVGQETVARIHFRGHVNKVVRRLELSDADGVGRSVVHDGRTVGVVTSAVVVDGGAMGLGMVAVSVPEGATAELDGGGSCVIGPIPTGTKIAETPS